MSIVPARAQQPPIVARGQIVISGIGLQASPEHQTIPRTIATKVDVKIVASGDGTADASAAIPADAVVYAELRGPAFGTAVTIVAPAGDALTIPPLAIDGTYVVENIRLVSGGATILQAVPDTVTIDVIDKVIVSQVTTRALTAAEIQQKGIFVDQTNFDVVNFTAAFGITGSQQTIDFPVLLPKRPSASLPASPPPPTLPALSPAAVPPPPQLLPQLQQVFQTNNVGISGLTLKIEDDDIASQFSIPPIPGVIVIPGNIAYLHQFFSVLLLVSNVAPGASNLVVRDATATIVLPPGADTVASTDDDPLRMARVGTPPVEQSSTQPVVQAGPDGKFGTADDVVTMAPGENGNSEFLVEGRKEGVHTVQIQISAMLDGLPIGPVKITGYATGIVEVRNPTFSLTLSHPATVTAGEDYDLLVTVTNTSDSPANLVSVNLTPNSISGAVLQSDQTVTLDTIAAHDAATATFRLTSQVTGNVTATSYTSDDAPGKFVLHTAVGALGIPLSPNSLVLPPAANALPSDIRLAAIGALGQAYALATSPVVPAGLKPISQQIVYERATDVARAGQRVGLNDSLVRAVEDLTLDVIGNGYTRIAERFPDDALSQQRVEGDYQGFDVLFRQSARGAALLDAIGNALAGGLQGGVLDLQSAWANAAASQPPFISIATGSGAGGAPVVLRLAGPNGADVGQTVAGGPVARNLPFSNFLTLVSAAPLFSQLAIDAVPADGTYTAELNATGTGTFDLGVVVPDGDHLRHVTFAGVAIAQGAHAMLTFAVGGPSTFTLAIDDDRDGVVDRTVAAAVDEPVADEGPTLVGAVQVVTGLPDPSQFGQVVGLLFSEEISAASSQAEAEAITNYVVDANQVLGASLQPGGRVVLISLRDGIGPFFARSITVTGIADRLGHPMASSTTLPIVTTISHLGGSFAGQVRGADGKAVAHARLQLSQTAPVAVPAGALAGLGDLAAAKEVAVTVKDLDSTGRYSFDYVRSFGLSNETIHLRAVNLDTGETADAQTHINRPGQHLDVDIVFIGTGTVAGRAFAPDGVTPLAGAFVKISSLTRIGQSFGATTDASGAYTIGGVPAGNFTIEAVHLATNAKVVLAGSIPAAGATVLQNLTLIPLTQATISIGNIKGQIFRASDSTPAAGVAVYTDRGGLATTDASGSYEIDDLVAGPVTVKAIDQARLEQGVVNAIVPANATSIINVVIVGGTGTVNGVVKSVTGQPVVNAIIGGGLALVRTDANGAFTLPDVPVGSRQITALDETTQTTASATVAIVNAGDTANVQLILPGQGAIAGRVFLADGQTPMVGVTVFLLGAVNTSTTTDANGGYRFDHLPIGTYRLSAFQPDFSDGNIADSKVVFNGEVHTTNIVARGKGTVTGIVVAADGQTALASHVGFTELRVKTGALVPPSNSQCVGNIEVGDQTIEMPKCQTVAVGFESVFNRVIDTGVDGTFTFTNVFVGPFTVEAANGFSPAIIRAAGTIAHPGDSVPVVLKLEATSAVKGVVYQPDGVTPAGANIVVAFASGTLGNDPNNPFTVTTDAQGAYAFPLVNPGAFSVTATDTSTGLTGRSDGTVDAGAAANVKIRLLGKGSVKVDVTGSNGPIAGAAVTVTRASYPNDSRQAQTAPGGSIVFSGGDQLTEGPFSVSAFDPASGITGYASGAIAAGAETDVVVRLDDAVGTVQGRFLMPDGTTPIANAQVHASSARGHGYATTGPDGAFSIAGVFGSFTVEAFDPATARRGRSTGTVSSNGQSVQADIAAVPQGIVKGYVRFSKDSSPAAAADVTLSISSAFGGQLVTSTGIDGSFTFPGVSAGTISLSARDPNTGISGNASTSIVNEGDVQSVDIILQVPLLGRVQGTVRRADGSPALGAQVVLSSGVQTAVDNAGAYAFENVPVGAFRVSANAPVGLDGGVATGELKFDGDLATVDVTFIGTGTVNVSVLTAGGAPVAFANVSIDSRNAISRNASQSDETDGVGQVQFAGIPVGDVSVTAVDANGLAGSASGRLAANGDALALEVQLQPAGGIHARVLREDKTAPASGMAVQLTGQAQRFGSTATDGAVAFDNLALGQYQLLITDPLGTGIVRTTVTIAQQGQAVDLGTLYLDESAPRVLQIVPANGTPAAAVTQPIQVSFSEPVDPASVTTTTMPVTTPGGPVAGGWTLSPDRTLATFAPTLPYRDFTSVAVKVTTAVTDAVGKALLSEATSTFTTADSTPPAFVSRTPAPGARDVALGSVVRVAYSEAVDPTRFAGSPIAVSLNGSAIDGRIDYTLGNTVIVFTPASPLSANSTYSVALQAAFDVYGNAQSLPSTFSFVTLDTIAPTVDALTAAGGTSVKVGLAASLTATVSALDAASVDLLINGAVVQTVRSRPFTFSVPVTAALAPAFTAAARATDLSGNIGSLQTLQMTVSPDLPPTITITAPADGSIVDSGSHVSVAAHATDDIGVAQIGFQAVGAASATDAVTVNPAAPTRDAAFQLDVPADAAGGAKIDLKVAAIDSAGQSSPTAVVSVTIRDTTAPSVQITAPAAGALVDPGQTLTVTVSATDAGGVALIALQASGAASFSDSHAISPPSSSAQATFQVAVPSGARPTDQIHLTATATDAFGNTSAPVAMTATIRDSSAPSVTLTVNGGQTAVQPGRSITLSVSAADDGRVAQIGYEASGAFSATGTQAVSPAQPSAAGQFTFTVPANAAVGGTITVAGIAADASGNAGRSPNVVLTIVADQPPAVHITSPADGTHFVEGQLLSIAADASDDVGIASVEFRVNGSSLATVTAPPFAAQLTVPAGTGGSAILVEAFATDTASQVVRDSVTLTLDVDSAGPQVVSTSPTDQATGVSTAAPIVVTFSEPLDPATVTAGGTFQVSAGSASVAGAITFGAANTAVQFTPNQPLPLDTSVVVLLTPDITDRFGNHLADASGHALGVPLTFTFHTGAFGITHPLAGTDVLERTRVALQAQGSASLGIASVVFEIDGAPLQAVSGPTFSAEITAPAAATTPTLTIVAIGRNGAGDEVARDQISVNVVVGLKMTPPIVGIPVGGQSTVRLRLSSALAEDLSVTLSAVDPSVAGVPAAPAVIHAGQTDAIAVLDGVQIGNTTIIGESAHGTASAVVSVSEPVSGQTLAPFTAVTAALVPALVAAEVITAPASQTTVAVRATGSPAASTVPVVVSSSDDSIARVVNTPAVAPGQQIANLTIATGGAGTAMLTVRAGSDVRTVLVVVGPAGNPLPALANPVGASVSAGRSLGQVFAPAAARQTIAVRVLASPAAADTTLTVTSSDPAIASVDGPVVVRAGSQVATMTIVTSAAGSATLLVGTPEGVVDLSITVGSTGVTPPPAVAQPVGVGVSSPAAAGRLIAQAAAQQTIGVRLLTQPAAASTSVVIGSSNPAVASVSSATSIAAGEEVSQITIETGASGIATLTISAGGQVRELVVVVGDAAGQTPPAVAPPVGVVVRPAAQAAVVIAPVSAVAAVGVRLLNTPASGDVVVGVTSSNPEVAAVQGPVIVHAGEQVAQVSIATGSQGVAELTVTANGTTARFTVIAGAAPPGTVPIIVAPVVGVQIQQQ